MSLYIDKNGKVGGFGDTHVNEVLRFNPVFHTSILYWASLFEKIDIETCNEILTRLEAYPEGPVMMDKWRTPCHAAAQVGNVDKLKILLRDINNRY